MKLNKADKSREHTYKDVYDMPEYRQAMIDYALTIPRLHYNLLKN
jgi:hypothetical protein